MTKITRLNKLKRRRSYLVARIADRFVIDATARTIKLPAPTIEGIPPPDRYYVRQLLKTGFTAQTSLF
jgi:hypothetical protein